MIHPHMSFLMSFGFLPKISNTRGAGRDFPYRHSQGVVVNFYALGRYNSMYNGAQKGYINRDVRTIYYFSPRHRKIIPKNRLNDGPNT